MPTAKKPAGAKKPELIIQSPMGGNITPEEILKKEIKSFPSFIELIKQIRWIPRNLSKHSIPNTVED